MRPDFRTDDSVTPSSLNDEEARGPSRLRRRLAWILGGLVLLALLILTPPLVNANRYRGKIAESMSKSLGRPVHLDNVSLHLLPVPGFTLRNLVVSEVPEFGAEPTIRANTVEATLRLSSLWHRPVEFSTVRFVEPSVNLVRNAEGRWNLSDVLLHASRVESAPTGQRRAGPTPRFPYIEATGGRVNIKQGPEKLPFSLLDSDFALWLPSPQQWRVRLIGHPSRTDANITDPGRLRIEGELHRAASASDVPVNFQVDWHNAPLGEATRILTGDDWGWRGTLNLDTTITGTLGAAQLASKLTLGGLRRGEFFPAHPLDLQLSCESGFALQPGAFRDLRCTLPDNAPEPLLVQAAEVRLQQPRASDIRVTAKAVPARWALLWAALFSQRVPTDLQPAGKIDLDLAHGTATAAQPAVARIGSRTRRGLQPAPVPAIPTHWSGSVTMTLPAAGATTPDTDAGAAPPNTVLVWAVAPPSRPGGWPQLRLPATPVVFGKTSASTVSANIGETGYSFAVSGSASPADLLTPARYLPQLGDGIDAVLPPPPAAEVTHVQFTCTRTWTEPQTCTGPQTAVQTVPASGRGAVVPGPGTPEVQAPTGATSRLAPRSLSPLENAPFSTPRPSSPE